MAPQTHLMPEDEPHDGSHQDDEEDEGQEHGILQAEMVGWDMIEWVRTGQGGSGEDGMGTGWGTTGCPRMDQDRL